MEFEELFATEHILIVPLLQLMHGEAGLSADQFQVFASKQPHDSLLFDACASTFLFSHFNSLNDGASIILSNSPSKKIAPAPVTLSVTAGLPCQQICLE